MFLSEYHVWEDEIEPILKSELVRAYARRKQWEARLVAGQLAQIMYGPVRSRVKEVEPDQFLSMAGRR